MVSSLAHIWRLIRAGRVLARHDALMTPAQLAELPWPARLALALAKFGSRPIAGAAGERVTAALSSLGPSYIKLGQFLATRPDIVGPTRAFELKALQDRLPPFAMGEAKAALAANLGAGAEALFSRFGEPVAAASIAQVHRATTSDGREVAVKILRPGVEKRFAADLQSFYFAARLIERVSAEGRRLRPVAAVAMLEQSMKLELDLRMEASAIAEMAANTKDDPGFCLPTVDWQRTLRQVLTTEWIDGIPIADTAALAARGFDLKGLADALIQNFLRHAIRDGFFHADMHQGNLFVDHAGNLVAVDFGIMGRLAEKDRLFLAEILFGFITRDYMRVSLVHFDAGYVPRDQDPANFAQALRAIGEPIMDRPANEISMARLLTQLFEVTGQFNMQTQPQLLLLQKTMVVVEGVARTLNPDLNMWVTAEPVVRAWIERKLGPIGRIEEAAGSLGRVALGLPAMLDDAQKAATLLAGMAQSGGIRLDPETTEELARAQARHGLLPRLAMVAGAAALVVIALSLI
ncbi:MAG: 2-polyprenylphenol 6-hydroxylase [Alphaproteobacteria bacterium]|nr:2-polyprenylphenol 6-hydroxylase [Alphaproteobacteria bacterium]